MEKPFSAYDGADPYLFVSYSHLDRTQVYREMMWLYEAGFNMWYDEGIHLGSVWRESVANALAESSGCLFFLTQNSVVSDTCIREIHFALEEGLQVYSVRLDDTTLPRQLKFSLSDRQALVRDHYDEASYREQLTHALTTLTVKGPVRVLERGGSPNRYRTHIPLVCINPFTCPENDHELRFYAHNVATDICRCLFSSSFFVTEGHPGDELREPREIGRKHRAQYVLTGSLMRAGDRVRSSVKLTETQHGKQVWANSLEPREGSLPDMITFMAAQFAADISFMFWQPELERVSDIPEDELDAWGLSIRSMAMSVRDVETSRECIRMARLAVERDNEFAEGHANLADVIVNMILALFSDDVAADSEEALDHCNKALVLNKDAVYVLNRCSRVHRILGNESIALQLARRVDQVTSGEFTYTLYPALIINGLSREVADHAENNPRATYSWLSDALVLLEDYDRAEACIRTSVARSPASYMGWMRLANILGHLNKIQEGRDVIDKVSIIAPPDWTVETYRKSLMASWRNRDDIVGPLWAGLLKLE